MKKHHDSMEDHAAVDWLGQEDGRREDPIWRRWYEKDYYNDETL